MNESKKDKVNLELPIESVWLLPKLADGAVVAPLGISLEGHNPARVRNTIAVLVENGFVERVPGGVKITASGLDLLSKLTDRTSKGEAPVDAINKAAKGIDPKPSEPPPPDPNPPPEEKLSPPKKRLKGTQLRKEILLFVARQGPIGSTDLASALGVRSTTVMEHLHTLRDMGRVELKGWARAAKWHLVVRAEAEGTLDEGEPTCPQPPSEEAPPPPARPPEDPMPVAPEGLSEGWSVLRETLPPKETPPSPLDPVRIAFYTTRVVADALEALAQTGLWGADRNAAAEELVRIAIRERTPGRREESQ